MSYYGAGDYYMGGDIFGSIFGGIGGAIKGFISGGPAGAVAGGVKGLIGSKGSEPKPPAALQLPQQPVPGVGGFIQRMVPGGASGYTCPAGGQPGYHLNKSSYWTNDGQHHAPGTVWVKNRQINPGNARALRKGIRREKAFISLAKRALKGTGISVSRRSFARKTTRRR